MIPALRFLILFLFCHLILDTASAQLSWNTTSTGNLRVNVCYEQDTVHVSFSNISGSLMTSDSLQIQLPTEIFYVAGTLVDTSSFFMVELNISNLNSPVFAIKDLPAIGATINFSFRIRANCAAIAHFEGGGTFQNQYTYYHNNSSEPTHTTADYKINYPALSLSNVSNANMNVSLGASYLQELSVYRQEAFAIQVLLVERIAATFPSIALAFW